MRHNVVKEVLMTIQKSELTLNVNGKPAQAYLAAPDNGGRPGVLVLHAWWGLKPYFKQVCDRLAEQGFTALAPDLYQGRIAHSVDEAKAFLDQNDEELMGATIKAAKDHLTSLNVGKAIGVLGFSLGAAWALVAAANEPDVSAVVLFYGVGDVNYQQVSAKVLGHYAEVDEWEPQDFRRIIPMAENFDVVVIGAGPAGYVAAIRATQLGQKTAIVDKQWMGGVCLNVGCIPSKALLKNADVAHTLRERGKEFGFSFDNLNLDYPVAVKRSRQVSERLVKGVGFLMKKNNIPIYMGSAHLPKPGTVTVTDDDGKETELSAKNIIVATGASSAVPPGWEIDGEQIVTYLEAILQEKLPKSVVIIGAGAIGVEFATIWNSYGVEVTIVEMLPHLVPLEDEEVSKELEKNFKKRGINSLTNHRVEKIEALKNKVKITVSSGDETKELEAEQALVAIGFRPNSKGLGLEELGVKLSERGFIEIDERMATNVRASGPSAT
jgi:dienelactone hydrolase